MLNLWQQTSGDSKNVGHPPKDVKPSVADSKRPRAPSEDIYDGSNSRPSKIRRTTTGRVREDMVVSYDPPRASSETDLYRRLHDMDTNSIMTRHFKISRKLQSELGRSAADLYWRHLLLDPSSPERGDTQDRMRQVVETWAFDMPNINPASRICNVSPQFCKFVEILRSCEMDNESFRGIVLVRKQHTATMIVQLLAALDDELPHVRPVCITASTRGGQKTLDERIHTDFSSGRYNLLVITTSSEGMSLPPATVTIVFNLTDQLSQYIVTPNRSRPDHSLLVYMVEQGNEMHRLLLQQYKETIGGHANLETSQASLTDNNETTPEDDLPEYIDDPVTGRRIYPTQAFDALHHFFEEPLLNAMPRLSFQLQQTGKYTFACVINLPKGSLFERFVGPLARSSQDAKAMACFSLCAALFKMGLLDYRHFPAEPTGSQDHTGVEAKQSNSSATTRCYPRRPPRFWSRNLQAPLNQLYPLVVSVGTFRDSFHAPFVLFTRLPLPDLNSFPVFSNGQSATVQLRRCAPIEVDGERLKLLHGYTMRVARALANKALDHPTEKLYYFFAPIDPKWEPCVGPSKRGHELPHVDKFILWSQLPQMVETWANPLVPGGGSTFSAEEYDDCIIQDRAVEFTNRYFVARLRRDLSPLSVPEENSRESGSASYLEYYNSRRRVPLVLQDENQPLVEVSPVPSPVNNLPPSSKEVQSGIKYPPKYLIPECCLRFVIPASVFRTALLIPSITHMIAAMLLAKELNATLFTNMLPDRDLLTALSPITAALENDYERLELLGDTVLKFIASIYCFGILPDNREGALAHARAQIISNKALYQNGVTAGIPQWIQSKPMVVKMWSPADEASVTEEGPSVKQEEGTGAPQRKTKRQMKEDERHMQWLGDKTVADVVEALIGAAHLSGGRDAALRMMKLLKFNMPEIESWASFSKLLKPELTQRIVNTPDPASVRAVENITGVEFRSQAVLAVALTHSSLIQDATNYDRLEFLGDGVLDYLLVTYIFEAYPTLPPGGLSLMKSAMAANTTLAAICVLSGLHMHIQCSSPDFIATIDAYADKIYKLEKSDRELAEREGRPATQFWLDTDPPKALGDIVEALIGAIVVCERGDMQGAERFFNKVLKPFYERHVHLHTLAKHPTQSLFELLQAEGCQQHRMRKTTDGKAVKTEVVIHDIVLASAEDKLSAASMRKAAATALDTLAADPGFLARTCECRAQKSSKKAQKNRQAQLGYEDTEDAAAVESELTRVKEERSD